MRDESKFPDLPVHSSLVSITLSVEHWIYKGKGQKKKKKCSHVEETKIVILTCLFSGKTENDNFLYYI